MSVITEDFTGVRREMKDDVLTLVRFDATAESARAFRKVVRDDATAAGFDQSAIPDLLLSVGEAFTNAVRYGNAVEHGGVEARIQASPSEVVVTLEYAGESFCHQIPCIADTVNLKSGGLGRMIMYTLLDEVDYEFKDGYTIVRMVKRASVNLP